MHLGLCVQDIHNVISLNQFNFRTHTNVITARSLKRHFCYPVAIKTELNTGVSIQAHKLDSATSYIAQLQHRTTICTIASITVTATTIALWFKHRMKHISRSRSRSKRLRMATEGSWRGNSSRITWGRSGVVWGPSPVSDQLAVELMVVWLGPMSSTCSSVGMIQQPWPLLALLLTVPNPHSSHLLWLPCYLPSSHYYLQLSPSSTCTVYTASC